MKKRVLSPLKIDTVSIRMCNFSFFLEHKFGSGALM